MASPSSTTDDANKREQITFRFCTECSNMLYPKEDPDSRKLLYTCRTCQFVEDAATTCVFRNMINSASGETAGVTQDVATDPTVSGVSCVMRGCFLGVGGMDTTGVEELDHAAEGHLSAWLGRAGWAGVRRILALAKTTWTARLPRGEDSSPTLPCTSRHMDPSGVLA